MAERLHRVSESVARAARRLDASPALLTAARLARELLPGDSDFGDPLSTSGPEQPQLVGRRIAELTARRPGVLREAGLSALQVWQAISEAQGRGRGDRELAIAFTDLVDFSEWALEAGDERALELLRDVSKAVEPEVKAAGGEVVKRLGDGMMAVFDDCGAGVDALLTAHARLDSIELDGYRPRMRAGLHVGRPRRIGGDYLGVDVNIAARLAEQAAGGELLVSDRALALIDESHFEIRRKRRFKVKGAPKDLAAHRVSRASGDGAG
jgi:adenylate cyclase